ncbi:hypothetical protein DITRI_Ditri17bG0026900 [Diplodiscus trichospermus]
MCPDFKNDFAVSGYLSFISFLFQTADDVKELRATDTLHNYLGNDEEVADLFRKISRDLVPNLQIYRHLFEDIQMYCNCCVDWLSRFFRLISPSNKEGSKQL